MKNSFFNRFAPKEPKFFPMLKELAQVLDATSRLLSDMLICSEHSERMDFYHKIKEGEREGDRISRMIFNELGTTFITPFDREDIHLLADSIDDVIDGVNGCAKRIAIYNPKQNSQDGKELGDIVREGSITINRAIEGLDKVRKNAQQVRTCCEELHTLENKGDDIYEAAIMKLFEEQPDSIELIKTKEILFELERVTDAADRVGKALKTIIVKYA